MAERKTIVLGGGCFWCTEAAFKTLPGVVSVLPGYAGGQTKQPTYEQVSTGKTGHVEVVKVEFDPSQVGLESIFDLFFKVHDPTTKDRQGNDVGTQYRSIILFTDDSQAKLSKDYLAKIAADFSAPIVTEVKKLDHFWPAEDYHIDYFAKNKNQPYCQALIAPKLVKLGRPK